DVGEDIVVDCVDLHFVEDIDGVAVGGVAGRFEDDLEPCSVGAVFLIEEDRAHGILIDGFSFIRVDSFVIIDAVVFAEEEGDDGGFAFVGKLAIGGGGEAHGGGVLGGG